MNNVAEGKIVTTRLNRLIEIFAQYDKMLDEIIWTKDQDRELIELRNKANAIIDELNNARS